MYRFACDLNGDASLESLHVTASVGGVSFVLPLVAPTCGARTASNTKGIFCDKMPCQARVISRISRLGRAHEVSPSIVPFSPSSVYLRKSLKALGGTRNETNCRRQVGKNWMLSRQVRCRSFLRFKDRGRVQDSPSPACLSPRARHPSTDLACMHLSLPNKQPVVYCRILSHLLKPAWLSNRAQASTCGTRIITVC